MGLLRIPFQRILGVAFLFTVLGSARLSAADVALPRTMSTATPLLWPRLPAVPPNSPQIQEDEARIDSTGAEIDLYPTLLQARVSMQVRFGSAGSRGL